MTVGGTDVRDLTQRDLRSLIAVVPQDVYLFHASVAENLRLGDPDAGVEAVRAAAALAQADVFIERLPDGYDTVLGERGASISGGQRQRLAIARALLRHAPILVMDEAVANLDAETEAALQAAMAAVARDRTTLLIAHRPSTIRTADRVVVLEEGRVVEAGPFDDLGRRRASRDAARRSPGRDRSRQRFGHLDGDEEEAVGPSPIRRRC